jgi:predicted nucleic acid-binding protein
VEISIDASSWINLSNAGALGTVLRIPVHQFLFSPLVASECHAECIVEIVHLSQTCAVVQVTDDQIDGEIFLSLVEDYNLGAGETECLAICLSRPATLFCCDDKKARETAKLLLGENRVIGSLRLLKWAVEAASMTAAEAYLIYQNMKGRGGFLPDVDADWFNPEPAIPLV